MQVEDFINGVTPDRRQAEARHLDAMFQDVTGFKPKIWSGSIIGYGAYRYRYKSGREGICHAAGFSPRKGKHSIYIMPGHHDYSDILNRLGKHKMGAACLYVNKLADIDETVLRELIIAGLADLGQEWPVTAD